MRPQTTVKVLQWTLFAVLLAQHLLAYRMLEGVSDQLFVWSQQSFLTSYNLLFPVQDGLLFAQIALLIMWTHLGPGRWFVRWPLIGLLAWGVATVANDQYLFFSAWIQSPNNRAAQLLVSQMAVVFLGVLTIQLCGFRLRKLEQVEVPGRRWQYSLRSLLVTVLLSGVAVRVAQLIYAHVLQQPRLSEWIAIGSVAIPLGIVPLLALWATLCPGRCGLRLLVFALVAPALGVAGPYMCGHLKEWPGFVIWTGMEAAVIGGSLLIVRACGYRIVRLKYCGTSNAAIVVPSLNVAGG